ncbi:hypothetical protein ROHU_034976 [Labeo rohita]|uniref:Uncharacterized protein n=1 Tax=Labeo rohita TaxID=84645 RepID=A0A498LAZ3_LABRO|nr:hypothetical protein ROHU_034976 [Labeo rohita]
MSKAEKKKARAEQTQVPSLVVREDPDLSAPYPEILDDLTLVPSPGTFSKPLASHVMPSETVSAHPVMLPEASCLSGGGSRLVTEAFSKPALENDISVKPVSVTPVPVKPTPVTLEPVKSIPVMSDTVKPASVSPELVKSTSVIPEPVNPAQVTSRMASLLSGLSYPVQQAEILVCSLICNAARQVQCL